MIGNLIKSNNAEFKINDLDNNGNTALHLASIKGNVNIIKSLLDNNADIHAKNQQNQMPIQAASELSQKSSVIVLKLNGASTEWYHDGYSPTLSPEIIKLLKITDLQSPDLVLPQVALPTVIPSNKPKAPYQASNNQSNNTNEKGSGGNEKDRSLTNMNSQSLYPIGASGGGGGSGIQSAQLNQFYLKAIQVKSDFMNTASDYALNTVNAVTGGINNDQQPTVLTDQILHSLTITGNKQEIKKILKKNPKYLHSVDHEGSTVLHIATFLRNQELIEFFINRKLDPNIVNSKGYAPLLIAAEDGNLPVYIAFLLPFLLSFLLAHTAFLLPLSILFVPLFFSLSPLPQNLRLFVPTMFSLLFSCSLLPSL